MRFFSKILYPILGMLLRAIAHLPLRILYMVSDFLYVVVYYVVRYRRAVVRKNLSVSFPTMQPRELLQVERKFYHHFADYIVETIKMLHISDDEMRRRNVFHNVEIVDESLSHGRSSIIYAAHYGNWEWLTSITLWSSHSPQKVSFGQIYRTLRSKWFDDFMLSLRARFHSVCIEKNKALRHLLREKANGVLTVTGFISDQHPSLNDREHVVRFLNHDTAIITGSEVIARRLDFDVFYFDMCKVRRGYYETTIRKITCSPTLQQPGAITDAYAELMERSIKRQPELWLWTHNRWKNIPEVAAHAPIPLVKDTEDEK